MSPDSYIFVEGRERGGESSVSSSALPCLGARRTSLRVVCRPAVFASESSSGFFLGVRPRGRLSYWY